MELDRFLNKYGMNTTTNFDLKDILKDLKIKCKVIMRDEVLEYSNADNIIFNLQTTKDHGSHWVLCSKKHAIYFDSYGIIPPQEVFKYYGRIYL